MQMLSMLRDSSGRRATLALGIFLAGAVTARADETVTVSAVRSTASAPMFIAAGKGYFAAEGLDVTFTYFTAALPVALAVVSRDADLGITGLSAGFYNLAGKGAVKIIAGGGREVPGGNLTAIIAGNQAYAQGLQHPRDIAGKTLGLTTFGGPFHYDVIKLAEKYGFPLAGMKLLPLQSFDNIAAAIKGGTIDAALLTSVAAQPLEQRGDGKIIGWVGDEISWQLSAVFTSSANAAQRRPMLEHFLNAYRRATADYDAAFQHGAHGENAEDLVRIIGDYTKLSAEETRKSLGWIDRDGRLMDGNIADQIATWKKLGMVDAGVEADAIVDASYAASQ